MGVRHKNLLVEGVQFHPESILTAEGRTMLKNFLRMKGGTWAENQAARSESSVESMQSQRNDQMLQPPKTESILERIFAHRRTMVEKQKCIPSQRAEDLEQAYNLGLAPPLVPFSSRVRQSPYNLTLMAEIKRASPSKGSIAMDICAPTQARKYAAAGASVISVLTEPNWFKGSMHDLQMVRQSLEAMPNRPAILCKEFVFDEYQILEARLAGADTVLLIVKMLDSETLERLYKYSRDLGMEPLVEVNTKDEMDAALNLGARVIGVNNRDLTSFQVDLGTTSRLMENVPNETFICALSGISAPQDVEAYKHNNVGGVLVGEALMRAQDVGYFIQTLLGGAGVNGVSGEKPKLLVKICGTRSVEAASAAIEAGADMIGMILVPGRKRTVTDDIALQISKTVHATQRSVNTGHESKINKEAQHFFDFSASTIQHSPRPLLVGVFQNQSLSYIIEQQQKLELDIVQLHGDEPVEWASLIPIPVIHRFDPTSQELNKRGYHALPLVDSALGGTGQLIDVLQVQKRLEQDNGLRIILAGGLKPENLQKVYTEFGSHRKDIVAVDVSSGVEEHGVQSIARIREFVRIAKQL